MKMFLRFFTTVLLCAAVLSAQGLNEGIRRANQAVEISHQSGPDETPNVGPTPMMMFGNEEIIDPNKKEGFPDPRTHNVLDSRTSSSSSDLPEQERGSDTLSIGSATDSQGPSGIPNEAPDQVVANAQTNLENVRLKLIMLSENDAKNFSPSHPFSSQNDITAVQEMLRNGEAEFLFQQTFSDEDAQRVAEANASALSEKIAAIENKIAGAKSEKLDSRAQNLEKKIAILGQLSNELTAAVEAYDQLKTASSPKVEGAQEPSSFLRDLLDKEEKSIITGHNGKIILQNSSELKNSISSTTISHSFSGDSFLMGDPNASHPDRYPALLYSHGINLIRSAIFRDFGVHAVQDFDNYFKAKRERCNPLTVEELKGFMAYEKERFSNSSDSYFLFPGDSFKKLVNSSGEDEKIIKASGLTSPFNPFLGELPAVVHGFMEEHSEEEGINTIREYIKDHFKELTPLHVKDILFYLDANIENAGSLTIGMLKSLNAEIAKKRELWRGKFYYWLNLAPHDYCQLAWSGGAGFISAEKSQPIITGVHIDSVTYAISNPHPIRGIAASVTTAGAMNIANDQTRPWRKPPVESDASALINERVSLRRTIPTADLIRNFSETVEMSNQKKDATIQQAEKKALAAQRSNFVKKKAIEAKQQAVREHEEFIKQVELKREQLTNNIKHLLNEEGRQDLSAITEPNEKQNAIDKIFNRLLSNPDISISYATDRLDEVQQLLENNKLQYTHRQDDKNTLSYEDNQTNNSGLEKLLFSGKDLQEFQTAFNKAEADFLLQQARSYTDPQSLKNTQHVAEENADFFSGKAREIASRIKGAIIEQLSAKEDKILEKEEEWYQQTANAYHLLAAVYSHKASNIGFSSENQIDLTKLLTDHEGEDQKNIISNNGKLELERYPVNADVASRHYSKGISLVKLALSDNYGADTVERFNSEFETKILDKEPLTLGELRAFVESEKNEEHKQESYFLSPGHSLKQIIDFPSEGDNLKPRDARIIRASKATLYNPFLSAQLHEETLAESLETAKQGFDAAREELQEMVFFKEATSLNRRDILRSFDEKFGKDDISLTVDALRSFVEKEKENSKEWSRYYTAFDNSNKNNPLSLMWSFFQAAYAAIRVQPFFQAIGNAHIFLITWSIDTFGELTGRSREEGTYSMPKAPMNEKMVFEYNDNLYRDFNETVAMSKQKRDAAIQQAENKAQNAKRRASRVGQGNIDRSSIYNKKSAAIEKINRAHSELIDQIAIKRDGLVKNMLQQRIKQLNIKDGDQESPLEALNNHNNLIVEGGENHQKNIDNAFKLLLSDADDSINEARDQLEDSQLELEHLLHNNAQQLGSILKNNRGRDYHSHLGSGDDNESSAAFSSSESYDDRSIFPSELPDAKFKAAKLLLSKKDIEAVQDSLNQAKADFLLQQARTRTDVESLKNIQRAASEYANLFDDKINGVATKIKSKKKELKRVSDSNKQADINKQITTLENCTEILEKTRKAYKQFADTYSLKVRDAIEKRDTEKKIAPNLKEEPTPIKAILTDLLNAPDENNEQYIISQSGKLALRGTDINILPHRYSDEISLVKLGLADEYGMDAVQRFNDRFEIRLLEKNPLMLKDLKDFIEKEKNIASEKNSNGYFLSPDHSLEELLHSSSDEDEKIIRSSGPKRYNPFSGELSTKDYLSQKEDTDKEAIKIIQEGLQKMAFLKGRTALNSKDVLDHFNDKFVTVIYTYDSVADYIGNFFGGFIFRGLFDKEAPLSGTMFERTNTSTPSELTVSAFKSFIEEETQKNNQLRRRCYYEFYNNPLYGAIAWNLVAAGGAVIRSNPYIISMGVIPSMILAIAANYGGDPWLSYRQLPI